MNISIAIVDTNRDYLERLVEVLQEYEDLTVSMYTNVERLEQTLQTKHFDIVLFEPDVSDDKLSFPGVKLAVCLYSEEAHNAQLYADYEKVIKYQRISRIYKDILKAYADKAGYVADFGNSQGTKMIAVYSPVGGSGKTTIALALASKFSLSDEKVLFLSMEQLDSASNLNPHMEEGEGITSLLEAISENTNFELKLKGILKNGFYNMSYVDGFERIVDYNAITKDEIGTVLDKIRKSGIAEVIVIDMESSVDAIGQAVFEKADSILLVEKDGDMPRQKLAMFAQQAVALEYAKKMRSISNFVEGNTVIGSAINAPIIGKIPNYGNQPLKNILQTIITKNAMDVETLVK